MAPDFFDQQAPALVEGIPGGSYVLVGFKNVDDVGRLVKAGALMTSEGKAVCIYCPAEGNLSPILINGKQVSGNPTPAKFVCIDENGHNVTIPIRDANGHGKFIDVIIYPSSPMIASVTQLTDPSHLPPGRVGCPTWFENKFGKKLSSEIHEKSAGKGLTYREMLSC